MPNLLQAATRGAAEPRDGSFGRAKNVVILYLAGGPAQRSDLATLDFAPKFRDAASLSFDGFRLTRQFVNPRPGSNFSFSLGLGVAVIVQKTSPGVLKLPAGVKGQSALIRLAAVELTFRHSAARNETRT